MSGHLVTRIKPQFYLDSVGLMRLSRELAASKGVLDAAMMMATPANLKILENADLLDSQGLGPTTPGDLIIAVRAESKARADEIIRTADTALSQPTSLKSSVSHADPSASSNINAPVVKSLSRALEHCSDASLALISLPGAYAVSEARKAINAGLHAMIFSDNVPVADELALKQEARSLGRLVMGPDCGTSIINGVPLAFANDIPRGDIGIVGASGTGIQEVSCLLARLDCGISHAIGVGGRDLSAEVGGLSTLMALDILDKDASTRHIVLISKPPAAAVTEKLLARIASSRKQYTVCFIGGEQPALPDNASWAATLTAAAEMAANQKIDAAQTATPAKFGAGDAAGRLIRGLYCGGTLCAEAQLILKNAGLPVSSNAAIPGVLDALDANMHTLIDLGDDEFTHGRPHPMIEPSVRDQPLTDALSDHRTGALLLDIVLGFGAHDSPAEQLIASLPENNNTPIFASVTGTEADPQVRSRQIEILSSAGIHTGQSNAHAAALAMLAVSN